jgi:hypothetical protein
MELTYFSGKERDTETGLDYFGASLQRWIGLRRRKTLNLYRCIRN